MGRDPRFEGPETSWALFKLSNFEFQIAQGQWHETLGIWTRNDAALAEDERSRLSWRLPRQRVGACHVGFFLCGELRNGHEYPQQRLDPRFQIPALSEKSRLALPLESFSALVIVKSELTLTFLKLFGRYVHNVLTTAPAIRGTSEVPC